MREARQKQEAEARAARGFESLPPIVGYEAERSTVAAALESGKFRPTSMLDTSPGSLKLANFTIRDIKNYGKIDVSTVIQKSSNVGASRIALAPSAVTKSNVSSDSYAVAMLVPSGDR